MTRLWKICNTASCEEGRAFKKHKILFSKRDSVTQVSELLSDPSTTNAEKNVLVIPGLWKNQLMGTDPLQTIQGYVSSNNITAQTAMQKTKSRYEIRTPRAPNPSHPNAKFELDNQRPGSRNPKHKIGKAKSPSHELQILVTLMRNLNRTFNHQHP
jgi:hypothetical protein